MSTYNTWSECKIFRFFRIGESKTGVSIWKNKVDPEGIKLKKYSIKPKSNSLRWYFTSKI